MAMETRKRAAVNHADLNEVGRPKAKSLGLRKERALKKKVEDCLGDSYIHMPTKVGIIF